MPNQIVLDRDDLRDLYAGGSIERRRPIVDRMGVLRETFLQFLDHEERVDAPAPAKLRALFDRCIGPARSADEVLPALRALSPGNGRIGTQQVNLLVDVMRERVAEFLERNGIRLDLVAHDHAFGSGGDFWKTTHATTGACIIAAPVLPVCKTGTANVTSAHGSLQVTRQLGYLDATPSASELNRLLTSFGFAFVPLQALGIPYSEPLRMARRHLWDEAAAQLTAARQGGSRSWREALRTTNVPLDIFKVVSPNAQMLRPAHHSTGVCHLSMIPYVLGVYLHLGTEGMIVHGYDGIDELSTASSEAGEEPNNVIVYLSGGTVTIAEVGPENLGFARSSLRELAEEARVSDGSDCLRDVVGGVLKGPKRDFLVANAATLLVAGGKVSPDDGGIAAKLGQGARLAEDLIDSGAAGQNFSQLIRTLARA